MAFAFLDTPCRDTCSKHWAAKSGDSNHSVQASVLKEGNKARGRERMLGRIPHDLTS